MGKYFWKTLFEFLKILTWQKITESNNQRKQIALTVEILCTSLGNREFSVQYRIGNIILRLIGKKSFVVCANIAEFGNDLQILSELFFIYTVEVFGNLDSQVRGCERIKLWQRSESQSVHKYPQRYIAISNSLVIDIRIVTAFCCEVIQRAY